jgi:proteasome lid subunit RPN8/RPN11
MITMDAISAEIYAHAEESYPRECCGVITRSHDVVRLKNTSVDPMRSFEVSPVDYLTKVNGALLLYHSHPDSEAVFSGGDELCSKRLKMPLLVVSWPKGKMRVLGRPGADKELVGRPFIYGVYDCVSLMRDFYKREMDIDLPQFTRPRFGWWESGKEDPFTDQATAAGFKEADSPLEYGDMILFAVNGFRVPNHVGIYVGDDRIITHHLHALSGYEVYGARQQKATVRIIRYVG